MKNLLANLSQRQKISIAAVFVLAAIGIYAFVQHQREAGFKPLFTGVSPEDAAGIVQKLKEAGVEYRLPEGGGSVLVPAEKLPELRLNMAAAGLPKTGRIGFELFDKTNLGATEFTEHINYRRALEGELERSIMSLAEVEQARVHLTFPKDSVFLEAQQPAKASVMVKVKPGNRLAAQNVQAINHLVASAVEGLSPNAVSVLDMNGNLLGRPKTPGLNGADSSDGMLDYRHKIEADLLAKVNSTLEPLLGANRFRAGVSVECDYSVGEQSEETFDPTRSVMVSSQRSEDSTGATAGGAGGVPGTASALPRPADRPAGSARGISRMTENVTYQTSRTVRKMQLPSGAVRKISLAVLVDQQLNWERGNDGYKRVLVPPTPEKLKIIRDLVAGVTGFSAARGDQLVVESLPFETTMLLEPPPLPPTGTTVPVAANPLSRLKPLAPVAAAVVVLLALAFAGMFVYKRRGKTKAVKQPEAPSAPVELPATPAVAAIPEPAAPSLENRLESKLVERDMLQQQLEQDALDALTLTPVITKTSEVLAKHLRDKVAREPQVTAQILRSWIRDGAEVS